MDIVTHGLASLALTRGLFPRLRGVVTVFVVLAGTVADVDWLSRYYGASSFLTWHGAYVHSIFAASILFAAIPAVGIVRSCLRNGESLAPRQHGDGQQQIGAKPVARLPFAMLFAASACAALLHVAMDACQSDGVMLLWPFSTKRFAFDWLPLIDPWILTILVLAIGVPELLHLVSSEIGAKSKHPRGRTGGLIGLALVVAYIGARGTLHSSAVALMQARTFHGEAARRAVAFPESISLLTWHGIAETETALNEIDVNLAATGPFDPDTSVQLFKPEQSAILEAAQKTRVARQFLAAAQMPRASIEKTDVGSVLILRDMRYAATGETRLELAALIEFDPESKVSAQEIVWARELRSSF